jgi:uncharacterized protein
MSEENVEVVRRGLDYANRGLDALDPFLDDLAHPDYEWASAPGLPGRDLYKGRDAVRAFLVDFFDTWQSYTIKAEQIIDAGEHVVVLGRVHAVGKGSGAIVDRPVAYLHTIRDGKFSRTRAFLTQREALEAAGLSE